MEEKHFSCSLPFSRLPPVEARALFLLVDFLPVHNVYGLLICQGM